MGDSGYLHYGPYAMTVRGKNYQSLMSHLKSWNSVKLMGTPVVEGWTLSGNSPNLIAAYTVTFTLILDQPAPAKMGRVGGSGGGGGGGVGGGVLRGVGGRGGAPGGWGAE